MTLIFIDGETAYSMFKQGQGTQRLQALSEELRVFGTRYEDHARKLESVTHKMRQAVKGGTGDVAGDATLPLMLGLSDASELVVETQSATEAQSQAWHDGNNSVQPVPPAPKEPNSFALGMESIVNPDGAAAKRAAYESQARARQEALQHNIDTAGRYMSATESYQGHVSTQYPEVRDPGGMVSIAEKRETAGHAGVGSTHASSAGAGYAPAGTGSPSGGGGPSFGGGPGLPGGGQSGAAPPTSPSPAPTPGGGPNPTPGPRPIPPPIAGGFPITPGQTGDQSRRQLGRPSQGRAGSQLTGRPPSGGAAAGKADPRTILRGGQAATARLTGGTAGLQAGKAAGIAAPGAGAAAQAAGARGAAGAGRAGAGPMAGAGGSRGQGAEDGEHKNKYAMPEELDDGLQSEVDEFGEKVIDQETGHTVVNPVIGDPGHIDEGKG